MPNEPVIDSPDGEGTFTTSEMCCMQVRHETPVRLHVKISPAGVKRYEVPEALLPRYVVA
jgi:hypothetical protein